MHDDDCLTGDALEGACLSLDQLAGAAGVSRDWLVTRIDEGLICAVSAEASESRFDVLALRRARRMYAIERDFDAAPELAALVADLLEEMDALRARLDFAGPT